ncbi:cholinesterase-like [Amphiura filiformis]|uniref:cholinesterase-like n=1 Tax=Amphiura filiformis TaxID=82378 RepID=UPI003B2120E1
MIQLLYFVLLIVAAYAQTNPVETIKMGRIKGKRISVNGSTEVDAFLGIPFAEPISGERRFKYPVAKASWNGVFNAREYGHGCWQPPDPRITVPISDDCLNLNVWTPYPRPQNGAVLVYIHGGAYVIGASSWSIYDGKYLAAFEEMIIVSMNYRVGPFGFLATGDSSAPGNQGLYDQALALQWVQDNIATFGGDPNQVTIFGQSAGGASVSLHLLSPVSQSLFQRAGIISAGITAPWNYITQEVALERAKILARSVGCLKDTNGNVQYIPDMIKCLQDVDANDLWATAPWFENFLDFYYVPVYDGIFLPEDPADAQDQGSFKQCEIIVGSTTNEGNNFIAIYYRPWKTPNNQSLLRDAIDLAVGDYSFTCPSVEVAKAYAREGNQVYYYRFEERPSNSPYPEWTGVNHGDDVAYTFGIPLDPSFGYSSREGELSRKLMNFWANFARTGNPNSDTSDAADPLYWPQYDVDTQEFLVVNESLADGTGTTGSGINMVQFLYFALLIVAAYAQTNPVETIKTGRIKGKRISVNGSTEVDAFLGIPFAEPISGERRFKYPVPKASWNGVFNAREYGHGCWQLPDTAFPGFEGTEIWNPTVPLSDDCLNLNVWVPYPRPQNAAVLVWIYGGGYYSGVSSLSLYDGKYLAAIEGIIVVSMNYRVGAFGFLATGDSSAPGNQGLYDQALALQWVQDNIATFGGDPNLVTIFGESAGGASVSCHLLSPVSHSLFQRAGIQSAGITAPWAYITKEVALERAKLLAHSVGCLKDTNGDVQDIPDMIKCLQDVDANDLLLAASPDTGRFLEFSFVPVNDGIFLPKDLVDAQDQGSFKQCELIIGSTSNEGNYFLIYGIPGFNKDEESLLDVEGYVKALSITFSKFSQSFGLDAIAFQYRPWKTPNNQSLLRDAVDLAFGDYAFTCPSVEVAKAYAREGNQVYYYRFEERASNSPFPEWMGVLHGDEIAYIFGIPLDPSFGYSSREGELSRKLMSFWANFARTGNPNSDASDAADPRFVWPQYDVETQEYLVLNEALSGESWIRGSGVKPLECAFWREYLPKLAVQTGSIEEAKTTKSCRSVATGMVFAAPTFDRFFVIPLAITMSWILSL